MPVTAIFFRVMCKLPVSACKLMSVTYAYRDESSPEFPTGISNPDPDFSPGFRSRISHPDFRASFLPDFRPGFPNLYIWPGFPTCRPGFLTRIFDHVFPTRISNPDFSPPGFPNFHPVFRTRISDPDFRPDLHFRPDWNAPYGVKV
jgi:hypothetical protein